MATNGAVPRLADHDSDRYDPPRAVTLAYPDREYRLPHVAQVFIPGRGWVANHGGAYGSDMTCQQARRLRSRGIEHVSLEVGPNRYADFTTNELTN